MFAGYPPLTSLFVLIDWTATGDCMARDATLAPHATMARHAVQVGAG